MNNKDVFEYTLEDVLTRRYDILYSNNYYVNWDYITNNINELIILKDVVIPSFHITDAKLRKLIALRRAEDWETYGVYRWEEMYSRDLPRTIDEMREDDVRLALHIAKKYPEHSDIVCVREVEENFTDFPNDLKNYDSVEEIMDFMREKIEPIYGLIDEVYPFLIADDLINLEDYVPPVFLTDNAREKRRDRLSENGPTWLYELEESSSGDLWKSKKEVIESVLNIMFEMDDFIEKYPQYSRLIPDYNAFSKYGEKLIEELEGEK